MKCPWGQLAAVPHLEHSCSKGWGELVRLLQVFSSALISNHSFLMHSVDKKWFHTSEITPNLTTKDHAQGLGRWGIHLTLGWWSQTPARLCVTSATDASQETHLDQKLHLCTSSDSYHIPSLFFSPVWSKPRHRCHRVVGTSESFWKTELAELLGLVT